LSEQDDFVGRVRGLVIGLWGYLSADECAEVEHLIDHDEIGEALRALAWIIVEEDKRVPASSIATIRELVDGLVEPEHMPDNLDDHAVRSS
jgi:hypothetical protein